MWFHEIVQCIWTLTRNRRLIRLWCPRPKSNMDDFSIPTDAQVYVDATQEKEWNSFHALKGIQGRRENSCTFYYIYKMNFFSENSHHLDSSVSRASVHGSMDPKFESRLRQSFFFHYFLTWRCFSLFLLFYYLEPLLLYVKMTVLYENVMNLIFF